MAEAAVPFGISRSETSTGCAKVPAWTFCLYVETNASSTSPANPADAAAMMIPPRRVPAKRRTRSSGDESWCGACMMMSLSRYDGDAAAEGGQIARVAARAADCQGVDVLDEVPDD